MPNKQNDPQSTWMPSAKDSNRINALVTNEASIERLRVFRDSLELLIWCKLSEYCTRKSEALVKRKIPSNTLLLCRCSKGEQAKVLPLCRVVDLLLLFLERLVKRFICVGPNFSIPYFSTASSCHNISRSIDWNLESQHWFLVKQLSVKLVDS